MLKRIFERRDRAWKSLVGGLAGGLAATIAMSQYQEAREKISKRESKDAPSQSGNDEQSEDATVKAATRLAALTGQELPEQTRKKAGPIVHYSFGTAMGVVYGLLRYAAQRRRKNIPPLVSGAAFGTALFLGAHELVVPALGLAKKPSDSPVNEHLSELAGHLVYGLTLEGIERATAKLL